MLGSWKRRLPIATGILIVLVTGTEPGRHASNAQTTPAGSAGPATPTSAAGNLSRFDTSGHKICFVTVEPGVQLEVLDWGGTGETMLLLTGIGENAHVYDDFSYQFTDRFHVIGITRRGFGRSSQPAQGYDVATRARDPEVLGPRRDFPIFGPRRAPFSDKYAAGGRKLDYLRLRFPTGARIRGIGLDRQHARSTRSAAAAGGRGHAPRTGTIGPAARSGSFARAINRGSLA
jgi:hypothetical protein